MFLFSTFLGLFALQITIAVSLRKHADPNPLSAKKYHIFRIDPDEHNDPTPLSARKHLTFQLSPEDLADLNPPSSRKHQTYRLISPEEGTGQNPVSAEDRFTFRPISDKEKTDDQSTQLSKKERNARKPNPKDEKITLYLSAAGNFSVIERIDMIPLPSTTITVICDKAFPTGFTVFCDAGVIPTTSARFSVNGTHVHTENAAPFYLTGKSLDKVNKWMFYGSRAEVVCTVGTGQSATANIRFGGC